MLSENSPAPDFSLPGSDGKQHTLSEFNGRYLVLYFYPKDDTPGCTSEAKCLNGSIIQIRALGAEVVGVSADSIDSHGKFAKKYNLGFLLLSDPEKKMIKAYDSFGNKGIFGWGILRKTYIIDGQGSIAKIFPKVKAGEHDKEVLEFLRSAPKQA